MRVLSTTNWSSYDLMPVRKGPQARPGGVVHGSRLALLQHMWAARLKQSRAPATFFQEWGLVNTAAMFLPCANVNGRVQW